MVEDDPEEHILLQLPDAAPGGEWAPAASKLEAVSRISALTGAPPEGLGPGSKERKSVLTNLARHLDLDVDDSGRKHVLASQIASALGAGWDPTCVSAGETITLVGLNRILEAATAELRRQTEPRPAALPAPARSKLEAVMRIAALTGAPDEALGPGSKERKSALVNLVRGMGLPVDTRLSKPELARSVVTHLGGTWDAASYSTGDTITLVGLNRVLVAAHTAMARLGEARPGRFQDVQQEATAMLRVLDGALPAELEGRPAVTRMREAEFRGWAMDEWVGSYFEFVGLPALVDTFGGGPVRFANTTFDYALDSVWDLKTHAARGATILNSQDAVGACLEAGRGLGFVVLSGAAVYDETGAFRSWFREQRAAAGKKPAKRATPAGFHRRAKSAFAPRSLEAFHLRDRADLQEAIEAGVMGDMRQGRQVSGASRTLKYLLNLRQARESGMLTARRHR